MSRAFAFASFAASLVGAGLMAAAAATTPLGGYVSEAGAGSSGHATTYRLGAAGLALGQALFALALSYSPASRWVWAVPLVPLTVSLVALDAVFGGVSAVVSCSPGCPLPPHETSTARDLVHGGASILAVGLLSLALLGVAVFWPPGPLVRPSRIAAAIVVPLVAASGLAILIVGRGYLTGLLERAVLVAAVGWTLVACALLVRSAPPPARPAWSARRWRRVRADRSVSRLTP